MIFGDSIYVPGVRACVDFVGAVAPADVQKWIDAAHVVVISSRGEEGMPLVAVEAAQRGRPVVAFGVDGIPEAVVDGETGLLASPGAGDELAAALGALLGDLPRAAALGRAARLHAQRELGWQTHVDRYESLYDKLATRSGT